MKYKLQNALIISNDDKLPVSFVGNVYVCEDKIEYVGKDVLNDMEYEIIDMSGKVILPGFINCHCHTAMTLFRGVGSNSSFDNWWYDYIRPLENKLTKDDVYWASLQGIYEYLQNGITTFCDFYFYPESTLKAVLDTGIRAYIAVGNYTEKYRKIEEIEKEYLSLKEISKNNNFLVYCHSTYFCDERQFGDCIKLANKYGLVFSTHNSESLNEVSDCVAKNDVTPTKLLEEYGVLDSKTLLAHCTNVDRDDIDIFAKYGSNVVTNPSSNLKLGNGIAPLYSMSQKGVNICLGTDGASTNDRLDMFREMYLASTLQKALLSDASIFKANEVFKMATINGTKALGNDKIGVIKKGNFADIVVLDKKLNIIDDLDIIDSIVFSGSAQNVYMTIVNGKILYKNGEFLLKDNIENILKMNRKNRERLMENAK